MLTRFLSSLVLCRAARLARRPVVEVMQFGRRIAVRRRALVAAKVFQEIELFRASVIHAFPFGMEFVGDVRQVIGDFRNA